MPQPPFLLTYYNPFSDDPKKNSLVGSYLDYVKNTSLAKYSADVVGSYIEETSATQLAATESVGRAICGELYDGFSSLQAQLKQTGLRQAQQLGEISGGIRQISSELRQVFGALEGVNQRLELVRDEVKTSNVLLENIGELLRIPDSQKQRQHHIELALKFLKNARKDQDLYQDALQDLLDAEKLKRDDFFVLHRIGMIYLYAPDLIDLEKAVDYFTRAAKYAAVESDPDAARLSNVLNKRVNKKFADQADRLPGKESDGAAESFEDAILTLAAESYFQAGTALYALGRFDEAAKMAEKAVAKKTGEAKHHFFFAKYLTRSGKHEDAVKPILKAIELSPELAMAAVEDLDLNRSEAILNALNKANASANKKLQNGIEYLQQWADKTSINDDDLTKWVKAASDGIKNASYPQKQALLVTLAEHKKLLKRLDSVISFGFKLDVKSAIKLLKQNDKKQARRLSEEKTNSKYIKDPKLAALKYAPARSNANEGVLYDTLLATADESYFASTGTINWETESDTTPAIGEDGMVYFGLNDELIALDKEAGKKCWRFSAGGSLGAPMVGGYMVFFSDTNHNVFGLDGRTGEQIWKRELGGTVRCLNEDGIVFVDTKTNVYAREGNTGKILWSYDKPEELGQSIMIACGSGSLFVGGRNSISALDAKTGKLLWFVRSINESASVQETNKKRIESSYGNIYKNFDQILRREKGVTPISLICNPTNRELYFVLASCSQYEKKYHCFRSEDTGVFTHEGNSDKYIEGYSYNILKLSAVDGNVLWTQRLKGFEGQNETNTSILIGEDYIYTACQHQINSLRLKDGEVSSSYALPAQICGFVIGYNRIYVVGHNTTRGETSLFSTDKNLSCLLSTNVIFYSGKDCRYPIIMDNHGMLLILHGKKIYKMYSDAERCSDDCWPMYRQNPQGTGCATMPRFPIPPLEESDENAPNQIASKTVLTTSNKRDLSESRHNLSGVNTLIEAQLLEKSKQADVNLKMVELDNYGVPFNRSRASCFLTYNYENRFYLGLLNDEYEARKNSNLIILHAGLQEIAKKNALNIAEKILFVTADESCFVTATENQQVKGQNCGTSAEGETVSIQPQVLGEFNHVSCSEEVVGKPEDIVGDVSDIENENTEEAKRLMNEGLAAEAKERAKWFRKKDFSSALELYRQASAAGSTEAITKIEELTKLIAVK